MTTAEITPDHTASIISRETAHDAAHVHGDDRCEACGHNFPADARCLHCVEPRPRSFDSPSASPSMPPLVVDRVSIVGTTITIDLMHSAGDSARVVVTVEIPEHETDKHFDTTLELGAPYHKLELVKADSEDVSHVDHPAAQDLLQCQAEVARLTAHLADSDEALSLLDDDRNELEHQVATSSAAYQELAASVGRDRHFLWDLIHARETQLWAANTRAQELETQLTDAQQTLTEQSGVLDMLAGATIAAVPF